MTSLSGQGSPSTRASLSLRRRGRSARGTMSPPPPVPTVLWVRVHGPRPSGRAPVSPFEAGSALGPDTRQGHGILNRRPGSAPYSRCRSGNSHTIPALSSVFCPKGSSWTVGPDHPCAVVRPGPLRRACHQEPTRGRSPGYPVRSRRALRGLVDPFLAGPAGNRQGPSPTSGSPGTALDPAPPRRRVGPPDPSGLHPSLPGAPPRLCRSPARTLTVNSPLVSPVATSLRSGQSWSRMGPTVPLLGLSPLYRLFPSKSEKLDKMYSLFPISSPFNRFLKKVTTIFQVNHILSVNRHANYTSDSNKESPKERNTVH